MIKLSEGYRTRINESTGFSRGDRVFVDTGDAGTIRKSTSTKTGGIHTGDRNDMVGRDVRDIIECTIDLDNGWEKVVESSRLLRMTPVETYEGWTIERIENGQFYAFNPTFKRAAYRDLVEGSLESIKSVIDKLVN